MKRIDVIIGKEYGLLKVLKETDTPTGRPDWDRHKYYKCLCKCGNIATKSSRYINDTRNTKVLKSCGCAASSYTVEKNRLLSKHNLSKDRRYIIWSQIKQRCYNKNHKFYYRYGGRGIKVDPDWIKEAPEGFINFIRDMGDRPSDEKYASGRSVYTIDRIDTDGDYNKNNCRWATYDDQWTTRKAYYKNKGK